MIKCSVEGCDKKIRVNGMCIRHNRQIKNFGETRGNPKYSRRSPNEFLVEGDICKIVIRNIWGEIKCYTIIDVDDYEKCKDIKWGTGGKYIRSAITGVYLHNHILGIKSDRKYIQTDHINRDRMDNRKSNLRVCSSSENSHNVALDKKNKTGFKGVYKYNDEYKGKKYRDRWAATISFNGIRRWVGLFDTPEEAAIAYNKVAKECHGSFAYLNTLAAKGAGAP